MLHDLPVMWSLAACIALALAFVGGLLLGSSQNKPLPQTVAQMNEWRKMTSKAGYVPEMIAAGERAEVVEVVSGADYGRSKEWLDDKCHGCRYAGRYLYKGKVPS